MTRRLLEWFLATPDLEARMAVIAQQDEDNAAREALRAAIIKALMSANATAKAQPYVIELFENEPPTNWTRAHRYLDILLTKYQALK